MESQIIGRPDEILLTEDNPCQLIQDLENGD